MDPITSGILDVKFFVEELLRLFSNKVGGLREYVNNKGVIVGNEIRWAKVDTDGIATEVNAGSPIVGNPLYASTVTPVITSYEAATHVYDKDLAATNSAAGVRAAAAEKVANSLENKFTEVILTALSNYDDTNMEVGDASTDFNVDYITKIDYLARKNNWPDGDRMMLLPPQAEYGLKTDSKFYEEWSSYRGNQLANPGQPSDTSNRLIFTNYRGYWIAFMGQKSTGNLVGLPATDTGAATGYCWVRNRVGFAMNQAPEARVDKLVNVSGQPYQFYAKGSCGAGIIDLTGVMGLKMDATEPA